MGKGIDLAKTPENEKALELLDDLKDQLLIVFLKRIAPVGTKVTLTVSEIDDTGNDLFALEVDPISKTFTFQIKNKN